jgi:hypothetical protein
MILVMFVNQGLVHWQLSSWISWRYWSVVIRQECAANFFLHKFKNESLALCSLPTSMLHCVTSFFRPGIQVPFNITTGRTIIHIHLCVFIQNNKPIESAMIFSMMYVVTVLWRNKQIWAWVSWMNNYISMRLWMFKLRWLDFLNYTGSWIVIHSSKSRIKTNDCLGTSSFVRRTNPLRVHSHITWHLWSGMCYCVALCHGRSHFVWLLRRDSSPTGEMSFHDWDEISFVHQAVIASFHQAYQL